ncbi:CTLH/CRA C-terminal to lish motif domain-containing protein [Chaetomium sp. MPI-CAGE-AT-0009]|nr:CTLH/CRA C-terminal to lish motif domain-containing protein [Chaetomium sp. MPI-CAGE-AT-0009]
MTNPYQQHDSGSNIDPLGSGRLPPLSGRRPSYASVVSGSPSALAHPTRSGAFSHLLNPSPDSDQQQAQTGMSYTHDGGLGGEGLSPRDDPDEGIGGGFWPPRLGATFPYFSRAFDLYVGKDPLLANDPIGDDARFPSATPTSNVSPTGFLSPSYLRGTVYLQKLEEQHRARILAEREGVNSNGAAPPSSSLGSRLSTNGSSSHLPTVGIKATGTAHRGVAYDIVEKPLSPADEDDTVSPLPSKWNRDDKEAALEVLGDGYEVRHTGRALSDHEASAIRADHYMSPACGVYYFEITVLNGRHDKIKTPPIAIGFASKGTSTSRAPGWEPDSWGYHGDDGHSFASQNVGKPYADVFGVGDTVGCLVNFRLNQALFTKNGRELPIAFKDMGFKDLKGKLYPIVGLKKKEDHIMANFGQMPFMFDIDGYMKRQQGMIEEEIRLADTSKLVPGLSETDIVQQLVLQFLQHDGYVETARAFAEELHAEKTALQLDPQEPVKGISIRDDEDAHNRQRIRRAVLEGDIDRAMKYTDAYYPAVLRDNEQVYFRLRCRKFIEMIRKEAEHNLVLEERGASHTNGRRAAAGDNDDEEMLEAEPGNNGFNGTGTITNGDGDLDMAMAEAGEGGNGSEPAAGLSKLSQEALLYGVELQAEFAGDSRRETVKQLDDISSLFAYPNPLKVKEVAHLLDGSGRVAVAEELNSAILMSLGKSSRAALENVYAQTCVLLESLRKDGGDGAFVTVGSVVRDIPPSRLR